MRELDVRRALHIILAGEHDDCSTRVLDEMAVGNGRRRVDLAVINGELTGYEIKSATDTLERLPGQVELYSQVFDRMWLVVADKHYEKALDLIPAWWGVSVAEMSDEHVNLTPCRSADDNVDGQRALTIAQLLWRDEAIALLDRWDIGDSALRRGSRRHMYRALAAEVALPDLKAAVRSVLKGREDWR